MFDSLLLNVIVAFLSMFVVDIVNAIYIRHIQNDNAFQTATTSVFIFLVHSIAIISYVGDNWMLIPAVIGGFTGAYVGVLINKHYIGIVQR